MKNNFQHKYIVSLLFAVLFLSCSTEKNTFINRNYHDMTAHYNVYFNGNEAMKMGLLKIETRFEEDYTKILPINKESLPGTEDMVTSDMNISIEKGMKLIKLHSISKPPKSNHKKNIRKRKAVKSEYNKWIDDAYMMMGKAYLYQKDYFRASNTFTQIIRKYKNDEAKYLAYIWLIRTYTESERYTESRELIETLEGNDQFPKKLEGELAISAADLHLQQQHYDEAIQYLNIGIKKIRGNKRKTRYTYILAQLYQEIENNEKALETYHQVIRRRPDYKMLFNARINSASVYSGEGNIATLRKELNKMSKKKKNEPFLDQIYYALGNIIYNEGRVDDAVVYYKKSASFSVDNTFQRALSCLTLADIYFEKREYIPSGNYYDSAMVVLSDDYPNFKEIKAKHASLSKLVTNLVSVQTQDSLQYLAGLSDILLTAKIDGWIATEEKRIEAMQEAGEGSDDYSGTYGRATSNRLSIGSQGSGWYFYNPSTVSYGKQEFSRIWGDRKNEDNWRRKDKSISMYDEMGEPIVDDFEELIEEEEIKIDDPTKREYYLQNIPSTDSLMAISHQMIRDALYNAGNIFKTEFNDFEKSIESYRELDRRYPENIYELPSYFNLWDLYNIVENKDSSIYFRSSILSKYPESNYAKYLINPNYFIEEEARKDSLNSLYNKTFQFYKNRNYSKANQYSKMVISMNPDSALIPKIRFIEMISGSRELQQKQFADSLRAYVNVYPNADPTPLANQILGLIKEEKLTDYNELINTGYLNEVVKNLELLPQNDNPEDLFSSKWVADDNLLHYFIIAFPNDDDIDVNRLKFDIANYNIDHYTMLDFEIETETLNNDTKLIVVRNFDEKESALIYFLSIIRKQQVFKTLAGKKFINFIISNSNFREMLSDRTYDQYLPFFVKNYSTFTTGEFPDEELDSPEALMAKLKKDNEDELVEKGEYVLIDTEDENYVAPEAKEQIFKLDYSAPHFYMIKINEVRYRTGFLMRDITRYNSSNYRSKRLRVVPNNLKESTILLVSSFADAYEANLYLKEVDNNKDLFKSLNETEYETFIISNDNLSKLRETNDVNEWNYFYRNNFIYNKPPSPQIEVPVEEEKKEIETPVIEEEKINESQPDVSEEKPDENLLNNADEQNSTIPEDTIQNTVTPTIENNTETVVTKDTNYSGPFTFAPDEIHRLIYLLPNSGSNKTLLTTYLSRLNAMKFRGQNIKVTVEEFDNIRSVVVVSGIGNKEKAIEYFNIVKADSRIVMSLRNVNYKSFLITNLNWNELKQSKDINEYQKFYNIFYK